jgi:hypothetical protein
MNSRLQAVQFGMVTICTIILLYFGYVMMSAQMALSDLTSGIQDSTAQFEEDAKKAEACVAAAGEDFDKQMACYN